MDHAGKTPHILVISREPALAEMTRKAAEGSMAVSGAETEAEGRNRIRELRPDIIILGPLDLPESVLRLYGELREGWRSTCFGSKHLGPLVAVKKRAALPCRLEAVIEF